MKLFYPILFLSFIVELNSSAQELFVHTDPASNIGKGVLGVRVFNEAFREVDQLRSFQQLKFMYGLSPNLMINASTSFSNHHSSLLPSNFITNDGTLGPHTHGVKKGLVYPYLFENVEVGIKYKFLNIDGDHKHFRMAAYADIAVGDEAHDEAEPNLMGDNSGLDGGLIATLLLHKLAVSLSGGFILPYRYKEASSGIEIQYGNALNYNLSIGYLLLPVKYKSYRQINVNVYVEFIGKTYAEAQISKDGNSIPLSSAVTLEGGSYMEIRPSIQFIFRSNLRIDFSRSGDPYFGRSYIVAYPIYYVNIQRSFYFK